MKRIVLNQYEKVIVQDINDLQKSQAQDLYDNSLYPFFQKQNGCIGTSFTPSYVDATHVSLLAGRGHYYDSAQTGYDPKYRAIQSSSNISAVITAADASLNRIDLICLAPNEAVTSTASRLVKTGGVGPIVTTTVNKVQESTYTLQVVAGTPNASPAVPATPAGYIAIAQVLVTAATGVVSSASITDVRNVLLPAISTTPYANRYVSPSGNGTDLTLAAALTNSASGGLIIIMENITISTPTTTPDNVTILGRGFGTVITFTGTGSLKLGSNCFLRDLALTTALASGALVEFTGAYGIIERCKFTLPAAGAPSGVKFSANSCLVSKCKFIGVITPSLSVGLEFPLGYSDNTYAENVYTP